MHTTADDVYARELRHLPDEVKLRLVELIAHELAARNRGDAPPSDPAADEAFRARFRRHAGAARLGHATGADNERIDADLADEYRRGAASVSLG